MFIAASVNISALCAWQASLAIFEWEMRTYFLGFACKNQVESILIVRKKRNNQNRYPFGFDFGYSWWTLLNETAPSICFQFFVPNQCEALYEIRNSLRHEISPKASMESMRSIVWNQERRETEKYKLSLDAIPSPSVLDK